MGEIALMGEMCYECICNGQNYSTICRLTIFMCIQVYIFWNYIQFGTKWLFRIFINIHLGQILGGGQNLKWKMLKSYLTLTMYLKNSSKMNRC